MTRRTHGAKKKTVAPENDAGWFERKVSELRTELEKLPVDRQRELVGNFAQLNSMDEPEPVPSMPKRRRSLRERALTAFHEAGHAVVAHLFEYPFDSVEVYT